ncbi:MAG: 3',5'-cyclic-AMP phosphodiesterase [Aeromonadales bacterium]|nr:3',5'-cyclic-AMP phosphodiesterase [Aeromonadales bacterium]
MAPRYFTPKSDDGTVRVLQLTDCHLFADDEKDLLGVNTAKSFEAVVNAIKEQHFDYDFIAFTGDISQDYSVKSYQHFAKQISILEKPVFFLPGNHDDGPLMYRVFEDLGVNIAKNVITPKWQFVFLNSEVYAVPHGWIQRKQLDYAAFCSNRSPEQHMCLLVHHMPMLVGSRWLDTQTMHNFDEFNTYIHRINGVKAVVTGHIHQEFDETVRGIRYIATPSTSIQFTPKSNDFALDNLAPGWRYLNFNPNGTVDTVVYRLKDNIFIPNTDVEGY